MVAVNWKKRLVQQKFPCAVLYVSQQIKGFLDNKPKKVLYFSSWIYVLQSEYLAIFKSFKHGY